MTGRWPRYYILSDRLPVAVDLMTWAKWFGKTMTVSSERQIARTEIGKVTVSTVFLGVDHSFGGAEPVLFETMVFGGPLDREMDRYKTYDEAECGHAEMVTKARIAGARVKAIADNAGAR